MFQEYVVRPMVWTTLPRELQRTFMHLGSSGYNFPWRQFVNFSTLVRDTSERSKVFAQRKCAIELDKVELLRMLAVFYQNKHNPREKQYSIMPEIWTVIITPHKTNVKFFTLSSKYIKK